MPRLLKRGKTPKPEVESQAKEAEAAPAGVVEQAPEPAPEPAPAPEAMASRPAPPPGNGYENEYENGYQTIKTSGSLFSRMYGEPGERSRSDREREAAAEFEQAVAPVLDMLVSSVPQASSPEEAARALESTLGEPIPDPGAGAYIPGDAFDREARVYYRLLRRDYEKDPRPSLTKNRKPPHHLHGQYKAFPGTKGW